MTDCELAPQFELEEWQRDALLSWLASSPSGLGERHGVLSLYTGAGKTVIAVAAMIEVYREDPAFKFAVVVPTIPLANQWRDSMADLAGLPDSCIGMVGGGGKDHFKDHPVLVFVANSASAKKGKMSGLAVECSGHRVMLVADECHRYGANSWRRIFDADTVCRLGLSATPERDDDDLLDAYGEIAPFELQPHGKALGPICYERGIREAYEAVALPPFTMTHHGVTLSNPESGKLGQLNDAVKRAERAVRAAGCSSRRTGYAGPKSKELKEAEEKLRNARMARKRMLYGAEERCRIALQILIDAWGADEAGARPNSALLFHEVIGSSDDDGGAVGMDALPGQGAEAVYSAIRRACKDGLLPFGEKCVALEHSDLSDAEREEALEGFREGRVKVLVSVKALQEGIDLPEVDLGISLASSSSVRQRIQTMGRLLRFPRDKSGKKKPLEEVKDKSLHFLYVAGTPDEVVYRKEDWAEGFLDGVHVWLYWPYSAISGERCDALIPLCVSERKAWDRIKDLKLPQVWAGPTRGLECTYRKGVVQNMVNFGGVTLDQEMIDLLEGAKGALRDHRGRFVVTPRVNVVLKRSPDPCVPGEFVWLALGALSGRPEILEGSVEPEIPTDGGNVQSSDVEQSTSSSRRRQEAKEDLAWVGDLRQDENCWFTYIQIAALAAVEGAEDELAVVCDELKPRKKIWVYDAACLLRDGESDSGSVSGGCSGTLNPDVLPYAANAFNLSRFDLLRQLRSSYAKGLGAQFKRTAVLRYIDILLGDSRSVLLPGK